MNDKEIVMAGCECEAERHTVRSPEVKKTLLSRLKRIEGQVRAPATNAPPKGLI